MGIIPNMEAGNGTHPIFLSFGLFVNRNIILTSIYLERNRYIKISVLKILFSVTQLSYN